MSDSQSAIWDLDLSQMPYSNPYKRQRSGSYSKKSAAAVYRRPQKIPRAIRTRGTDKGYYEFPCTQMIRVFMNQATGFWKTDPTTNGPLGATGYSGLSMYFKPNETIVNLGNGGVTDSMTFAAPDATSFINIFDEVKIAKVTIEAWMTVATSQVNHSFNNATEVWGVVDTSDAQTGTSAVQEYSKSVRFLPDRKTSMTFIPEMKLDTTADAGSGTTMTAAGSHTGYVESASTTAHYGAKFYFWKPYDPDGTSEAWWFNMKVTQVRRYKRQR